MELIDLISDFKLPIILLFILPGFLILKNFDHFGVYQRKLNNMELTLVSLAISLVIYFPTHIFYFGIEDENLFIYYYGLLMIGFIVGTAIFGKIIKIKYRSNKTKLHAWVRFADRNVGEYILINTINGKRYMGYLLNATQDFDDKNQDIVLGKPDLIKSDGSTLALGEEIFFPYKSIESIVTLTDTD